MFDAAQTSRRANSAEAPTTPNERVSHLELVEGDTYADWEAAYLDNVERIYRLMYTGVGNRPDADDLTAQVLQAVLDPLRLNSSKEEVRAYLLATARTLLASHWRCAIEKPGTFRDPDTDIAVRDERSEPDGGDARRDADPVVPDLRLLKSLSVRDSAVAACVGEGSGKVLQYRALFVAANLAERD